MGLQSKNGWIAIIKNVSGAWNNIQDRVNLVIRIVLSEFFLFFSYLAHNIMHSNIYIHWLTMNEKTSFQNST